MPRPRKSIPSLCENAKGYLYSRHPDGRQIWFGHKDNPESADKYAEFLKSLKAVAPVSVESSTKTRRTPRRPTVNEVCLKFVTEHFPRYQTSSGAESAERRCMQGVIRHLRNLYGNTAADDFGPLKLRTVREAMVEAGWTRRFINKQIIRLRFIFRLGVSHELVKPEVLAAIDTVPPLAPGETKAPDPPPRMAVPQESIDAVRQRLRFRNRDILDLLLLTGARPGELLRLCPCDIDRSRPIWRAELDQHKTAHRGKQRVLLFNETAQKILKKYIRNKPKSRMFPIRIDTFSNTIKSACKRAGIPRFCPHQLRHTVATRLADEMGVEAAQRLLGHSGRAMTEHYSRAAEKLATEAAKRLG